MELQSPNKRQEAENSISSSDGTGEESVGNESGYSSDYYPEDDKGSESDSDSFFSEDENIGVQVEYLNNKRNILKRVNEFLDSEDDFCAANAREEQFPVPDQYTSIWSHAKDTVRTINQQVAASILQQKRARSSGMKDGIARRSNKRILPNPKDPAINVTRVQVLPATDFPIIKASTLVTEDAKLQDLFASTALFHEGQWMARAIIWSSPPGAFCPSSLERHHHNDCIIQDSNWRFVANPKTCTLGLVIPSAISMDNAVDMEEALSLTNEARLIAAAVPPFSIVYANKAFSVLSETHDGICIRSGYASSSTATHEMSVIGKPVETILRIAQGFSGKHDISDFLDSCIVGNKQPCRIQVVPVVDRARRRRTNASTHLSCMSHILVRIHPSEQQNIAAAVSPVEESSDDTKTTKWNNKNSPNMMDQRHSQHGMGTVG